jgi:hypothetical protein
MKLFNRWEIMMNNKRKHRNALLRIEELEQKLAEIVGYNHTLASIIHKEDPDDMHLAKRLGEVFCEKVKLEEKLKIAIEALEKIEQVKRRDGNDNEYEGQEVFIAHTALFKIKREKE